MNNPPEQPRMSSLDRRIEAARRRGERERAAAHPQPTQGLTSTMSTESCDIAQPRNHQPVLAEIAAEQYAALVQEALMQSWQAIQTTQSPVSQAMDVLRQAMQEDPDLAQAWHTRIATAVIMAWAQEVETYGKQPNLSRMRRLAHNAAMHVMQASFGADTSKHADEVSGTVNAWQDTRPVKPNPNPVVGPGSVLTGFEWAPEELAKMQSCHKRGLDRLLYAPKETPADPVHTLIQQEAAAPHPWARFLPGRQASQLAQPTAGDNTQRGIGGLWIGGNGEAGAK